MFDSTKILLTNTHTQKKSRSFGPLLYKSLVIPFGIKIPPQQIKHYDKALIWLQVESPSMESTSTLFRPLSAHTMLFTQCLGAMLLLIYNTFAEPYLRGRYPTKTGRQIKRTLLLFRRKKTFNVCFHTPEFPLNARSQFLRWIPIRSSPFVSQAARWKQRNAKLWASMGSLLESRFSLHLITILSDDERWPRKRYICCAFAHASFYIAHPLRPNILTSLRGVICKAYYIHLERILSSQAYFDNYHREVVIGLHV